MSQAGDSERIDTLLALALASGAGEASVADSARADSEADPAAAAAARALELLSALGAAERLALERRAAWYARLTPAKQREWLAHALGRARARAAAPQLDEHVHPSHVIEALGGEPAHVRKLVIEHLPPALAARASKALGVAPVADDQPGAARAEGVGAKARRGGRGASEAAPAKDESEARAGSASPEVVSVVRRAFLSHFTSLAELERPSALELLSGAELARLVRLLGVRETALACRGIPTVEAVAPFLRRFAAEDARAIAAHLSKLTEVEPRRVAFAEKIVQEAFGAEPDPGAMLDRAGLRLLAVALSRRGAACLRYTAQKLPVEAASWLAEMSAAAAASHAAGAEDAAPRDIARDLAHEAEALAASVRRPPRVAAAEKQRAGAPERGRDGAAPGLGPSKPARTAGANE